MATPEPLFGSGALQVEPGRARPAGQAGWPSPAGPGWPAQPPGPAWPAGGLLWGGGEGRAKEGGSAPENPAPPLLSPQVVI